jgi:hypothetical protein
MDLKDTLTTLATSLVEQFMEAVRSASIADISGDSVTAPAPARVHRGRGRGHDPASAMKTARPVSKPTKSGRLARRTPEQIEAVVADIAALLKRKGGLRSEHIRAELDLDKRELPLVIKHGLETKAFVVLSGQRRATTYGIRGAARAASTPGPKAAKKAAKKAKKAAKKAPKKVAKPAKKAAKAKPSKKVKKAAKKPAAEKTVERAADVAAE